MQVQASIQWGLACTGSCSTRRRFDNSVQRTLRLHSCMSFAILSVGRLAFSSSFSTCATSRAFASCAAFFSRCSSCSRPLLSDFHDQHDEMTATL